MNNRRFPGGRITLGAFGALSLQLVVAMAEPPGRLPQLPASGGAAVAPTASVAPALPEPIRGRVQDRRRAETSPEDAEKLATKAIELAQKNPNDPRLKSLRKLEAVSGLKAEEKEKSKDPARALERRARAEAFVNDKENSEKDRFEVRSLLQERERSELPERARAAHDARRIRDTKKIIEEFPQEPRGYGRLIALAKGQESAQARALASEIIASPAPENIKAQARRLLEQRKLEGNPLKLTGLDLKRHRGRVVVLYAWSALRPETLVAAQRWARADIQLIGINLDKNPASARDLVAKLKIPGEQVYDQNQLEGPSAQELCLTSPTAVYLINKKGLLTDVNGSLDTLEKISRLVAEGKGK